MRSGFRNVKHFVWVITILIIGMTACSKNSGNISHKTSNAFPDTLTPISPKAARETNQNNAGQENLNKEKRIINQNLNDSRQDAITRAVAKVSPAVVSISVLEVEKGKGHLSFDPFYGLFFSPGQMHSFKSLGSGFIISPDGYVVTNQHVIGKNPHKIVVSLSNGKSYDAKIIGMDDYADIALLKIHSKHKFKCAHFGNSNKAIVGEWCIAMGNPFGLFEDEQPTVTVGVVSAVKRDFKPDPEQPRAYLDMIQTDAAINKGNSGGPLVNTLGQVIGMNTFIYTGGTSHGFVGLSFAIPSNTIVKIISELKQKGKVSLGYDPGFQVKPITQKTAYMYNLPTTQGVFVYSVNKDGPAYKAGILPGDVIIKIGNELIYSYTHFQALLREYHIGDTMRLVILRRDHFYETSMKLRNKVKVHKK